MLEKRTSLKTAQPLKVPRLLGKMAAALRTSLTSLEHYLDTFVFDRLSRMEAALVRLFSMIGQEVPAGGSVKRFSVDDLMNQLDSQRLKFEGQLRSKSAALAKHKEELAQDKASLAEKRAKMEG